MLINNVNLNINFYKPKESNKDTTIIFTHGMAEYSKSYEEVALFFQNKGFHVITYDVRGHGKSEGKRGYVKSYMDFVNDLKEIVNLAYKETKNVFLAGHSMGGLITNLYASIYNNVKGVINTATPTEYSKELKKIKYLPRFLFNNIKLKTNFNDTNLITTVTYQIDEHDLEYVYFKLINEILFKGVKHFIKNTSDYKTNILLIYSNNDVMVPSYHGINLYNKLTHGNKKLILLEKSKHNILNDIEKELAYNEILNWISNQI